MKYALYQELRTKIKELCQEYKIFFHENSRKNSSIHPRAIITRFYLLENFYQNENLYQSKTDILFFFGDNKTPEDEEKITILEQNLVNIELDNFTRVHAYISSLEFNQYKESEITTIKLTLEYNSTIKRDQNVSL